MAWGISPMDVATLALAPRRIVVADDGFMDRVEAVPTRLVIGH